MNGIGVRVRIGLKIRVGARIRRKIVARIRVGTRVKIKTRLFFIPQPKIIFVLKNDSAQENKIKN